MKHKIIPLILAALATIALPACEDDKTIINPDPGQPSTKPDATATSKATLSSAYSPGTDIVLLNIGDPENENLAPDDLGRSDQITLKLTAPLDHDLTLRIGMEPNYANLNTTPAGHSLAAIITDNFKKNHNIEPNASNENGEGLINNLRINESTETTVTIKAGETESAPIDLFFIRQALRNIWIYLFPIQATDASTGELYAEVNYLILPKDAHTDAQGTKPFVFVGHVDTEVVNPLIATQLGLKITKRKRRERINVYSGGLFDIINLRTATIKKSSTGNAELYLNADISHVLKNKGMYIRPLQQAGIKTCLVVKGGGTGLGFSNMTDIQIKEFVNQLKVTVDMYGLDGVNLFDNGAAYDMDGAAEVNPESYAKLIKAIKTAMPDKLLTLVDTRATTEALCNPVAGISVGDYLDYAWSALNEFTAPYEAGYDFRPIAGIQEEKYGTLFLEDWSQMSEEFVMEFNQNPMFADILMGLRLEPLSGTNILVYNDIPYYDYYNEGFFWELGYFQAISMPDTEDGYSYSWDTIKSQNIWSYYAFKKDW